MSQGPLTDVKAFQGNKGTKWVLQVRGNATVYTEGSTVETADLEDGFNPKIALFAVTVNEVPGPMKGMPRPFTIEREVERERYDQVTLNPGEENSVTVDIIEIKTVL